MKKVNQDIKNKTFERVYLLYGEDSYLRSFFVRKLKDGILESDTLNLLEVSGRPADAAGLRDFTDTAPFFADRRLVILKDTGLLTQSSEGFAEWIESLPETACVIFSEESADKRTKLYKTIRDKGYILETAHPDEKTFSDWALKKIGSAGLSVTRDAFSVIMDMPEYDLCRASGELDKLIGYCLEKGKIEKRDAELMLTKEPENRVFDMIDALSSGQKKEAMQHYYDLLALKEPPMRILYLLGRHFNRLLLVKRMLSEGRNRNDIAEELGIKPFAESKLEKQAGRFREEGLRKLTERAVELDFAVKSGNLSDTVAAELYILEASSKKGW